MSVELPEATILATQMNEELPGKRVGSCSLANYEKLQRIGFVNRNVEDFDQLIGGTIDSVTSRGTVIRTDLNNDMNLLLAPEYGGRIRLHSSGETLPKEFHIRLGFTDGTFLTVRLTSMGLIYAVSDESLEKVYVYRRDFLGGVSPVDEAGFTFDYFSNALDEKDKILKSMLVGKEAVIIGLGNSAFQEIAYRAKIHPKRRTSELGEREKRALYEAVREVVGSRIRLGGKDEFIDLYGKAGSHHPFVGPHMKGQPCPECGATIEKEVIAGGPSYFCPSCQK